MFREPRVCGVNRKQKVGQQQVVRGGSNRTPRPGGFWILSGNQWSLVYPI